jgi:hypothetical protein
MKRGKVLAQFLHNPGQDTCDKVRKEFRINGIIAAPVAQLDRASAFEAETVIVPSD